MASSLQNPFDSDAESAESPATKPKRGRKPGVKRQAPATQVRKKKQPVAEAPTTSSSESELEEGPPKRSKDNLLDDSEEEKTHPIVAQKLQNLLWRRSASGYTSQRNFAKKGDYYIDFRISFARDAELKDGYKKTLITFKSCTNNNSEVFKAASELVSAAKKEYKNITPILYPHQE